MWQACVIFFGVSSFLFLVSVSVYGGKINTFSNAVTNGRYGPGFGLAVFSTCCVCRACETGGLTMICAFAVLFVETFSAIALWVYRKEISEGGPTAQPAAAPSPAHTGKGSDPGLAYTEQTVNATTFNVSQIANRWSKSKAHSTAIFLAVIDLLFVIISLVRIALLATLSRRMSH